MAQTTRSSVFFCAALYVLHARDLEEEEEEEEEGSETTLFFFFELVILPDLELQIIL